MTTRLLCPTDSRRAISPESRSFSPRPAGPACVLSSQAAALQQQGLIFLRAPQCSSVAVKLSWKWLWELHAGMLDGFCISTRHTFRRSGPPPRIPCWDAAPTMKSIELPDATRSAAIAALPSTARPARHVRPTMRPSRLRMQEMRCSVRSIPALLSSPKSPSCIRQDTFQHAGYGISTVLVGARRDCPPMP